MLVSEVVVFLDCSAFHWHIAILRNNNTLKQRIVTVCYSNKTINFEGKYFPFTAFCTLIPRRTLSCAKKKNKTSRKQLSHCKYIEHYAYKNPIQHILTLYKSWQCNESERETEVSKNTWMKQCIGQKVWRTKHIFIGIQIVALTAGAGYAGCRTIAC